ncbi:hypothetical protein HZS_7342 [Henneguya salminicola]|nr:hypothetical protein HZS_7342 [Henneguya salminicola]
MPKCENTTDFRRALINVIEHEFPVSILSGVYFYSNQTIDKKIKKYDHSGINLCQLESNDSISRDGITQK